MRELAQLARLGEPDCRTRPLAHLGGGELAQAHQQDPFRFEPGRGMQQDRFAAPGGKFATTQDRGGRLR